MIKAAKRAILASKWSFEKGLAPSVGIGSKNFTKRRQKDSLTSQIKLSKRSINFHG